MNLFNLLKIAIKAINNNKFRSFLSMLGIIIGVAAVIIMMAIGQGSKESVRANISKMGTNMITIRPGADMMGGVRQDPQPCSRLKWLTTRLSWPTSTTSPMSPLRSRLPGR